MSIFSGLGVRARLMARFVSWAVLATAGMNLALAAPASAQCPFSITRCGCTIQKAGLYWVANNLSAFPATADCIRIRAKGSILNLNGADITGPSNGSSTGAGVHVMSSATGSFVEGLDATLSGWKYGIEDDAGNVLLEDFTTQNNDKAGVLLLQEKNSTVINFVSQKNGGFGVWLAGASVNQIGQGQTLQNELDGVLVGCQSKLGKCTATPGGSNQNMVFGMTSQNNGQSGVGSGITVQFNSNMNWIERNTGSGNAEFDLNDRHGGTSCAKDIWFANSGSASKNCIQ